MKVEGRLARTQRVQGEITVADLEGLVRKYLAIPEGTDVRFFVKTASGRHYLDMIDPVCFDANWSLEDIEGVPDAPKQG